MSSQPGQVFIIDDDHSVRRSISLFLKANGIANESFQNASEFLSREAFEGVGCLLLDVNLDGENGFDLQAEMLKMDTHLPIIFISAKGNIHMSVRALKNGAINFLEKPFAEDELLQCIDEAFELCRKNISEKQERIMARKLLQTLSPRESEILNLVITGLPNKNIADHLKIAEHTVKIHRQNISEKLCVKSVPQMMRIVEKSGLKNLQA
jgi:FixJ family two-component response regulator